MWGNLTRISTDGMCDFPRISTDFWAAVKFNTDFHGWDVWFSTDFHRFIFGGGQFIAHRFHGLSVRWNYLCYLCNLCEILGVGYEKRTAVLAVLCVKVAGSRIELETSGLWIRRSNQLSYPAVPYLRCKVTILFCNYQASFPVFAALLWHWIVICRQIHYGSEP